MTSVILPLAATCLVVVFLFAGIPIAYALGIIGAAGLYITFGGGFLVATLQGMPFSLASQFTFLIVPMFILMGAICARTGIITSLYNLFYVLTSRIRGGLYQATILSSAAFGAISGSTVVAASVFSKVALPEMRRYGYNMSIAAGCIAAAGTLSAMIPPSLAMVIYGILTNESIGALLLAGVIPGLLTMVCYLVGVRVMLLIRPHWAPPMQVGNDAPRVRATDISQVVPIALLASLVIGGIYAGWFSPSAAGTVGAAGAILISLFTRKLTRPIVMSSILEAITLSAALFSIIIAGMLFSRFLISTGVIREFSAFIIGAGLSAHEFMAIVVAIFLVVGTFVDGVSVLVIALPFVFPIAKQLGIDPIWLGVVVVKLIEIAAITPPVGLNLFAVLGASNGQITSREMFVGVWPFILVEFITLGFLFLVPGLATWIPDMMIGSG